MIVQTEVKDLLAGAVAAAGYELWGAEMLQIGRHGTLRVYIDTAQGVNIDDCAKASRQITAVLEVEQPALRESILEVSSPGLFRPLFTLEQYARYVNTPVKLKLKQADAQKRKNFSGILIEVKQDKITLKVDEELVIFAFAQIAQGHLNPEI